MDVIIRSIDISDGQNVMISGDLLGQDDWRSAVYIKIIDDGRILARKRVLQVPCEFELICHSAVKKDSYPLYLLLERYHGFAIQTKVYRLRVPGSLDEHNEHQGANEFYREVERFLGQSVLMVLKPKQLSILGQVFMPVICGTVSEITREYVEVQNVNIRMNHAPDFEFPTPLIIPLSQLSVFTPFDRDIKFSLV